MNFIAHRGYSAKWTENSIPAFKAVLENRFFPENIIGIELDIQLTADKKMIVFHDIAVEKIPVAQIDYKTLCLKLASREIPLFGDVLDFIAHRTALYVEIKDGAYDKDILIADLKSLLKKYTPANDIIIHSFSVEIMKKALRKLSSPGIEFGFLCSNNESIVSAGEDFIAGMNYIHPQAKFLLENEENFLKYGKTLNNVWTVNDIDTLNKLKNSKCAHLIKAITTDNLELIGKSQEQ